MTEEANEDEQYRELDYQQPDFVLQLLQSVTDQKKIADLGVTLATGGLLISGDLIGRAEWAAEIADAYEALRFFTRPLRDRFQADLDEQLAEAGDDGVLDLDDSVFIHLKNARYLTGASSIPSGPDGIFWRGRISDVTGWSYGTFGTGPKAPPAG